MEIINYKKAIVSKIAEYRADGLSIGLVPTMGALHNGHISLVSKAVSENDRVVVSIFVNPTQFNDPDDLRNYPRTEEKDIALLKASNVDIVFMPDVKEMYPETETDNRKFDLYPLDTVMEGKFRKNHFNGVAQIVTRLFETTTPDRAYFGQKDFQQLVIIKRLVSTMDFRIDIVPCPIVREPDGLAMSSRNLLLSPDEREIAPFISEILLRAKSMKNDHTPDEITNWVIKQFAHHKKFRLEYFEIVDDLELKKINDWSEKSNKVGCIAVHLGRVRLIDNIIFA